VETSPALLDAARQGHIGEVLRLARRRAGMTQAQLAAAIGYSQAAVSRIERGAGANAYDVRTLRGLASILMIPAALLGLSEPPCEENEAVQRRDFLRVTTAAAAVAAAGDLLEPGRVGRTDVAEIQQTIDDLRALDQRTGGDRLHRLAGIQVKQARALLARGTYGADIGQQLSSVLGEAAILVGWLSFDAGRHDASAASYAEAITAAGAAADELVAAHAYANLSMLALAAAQPQRAVQYAQAGQRAATRHGGPRLRALLFAREAQGHAARRDGTATVRRFDGPNAPSTAPVATTLAGPPSSPTPNSLAQLAAHSACSATPDSVYVTCRTPHGSTGGHATEPHGCCNSPKASPQLATRRRPPR
jgi:transcriptional regulator with XRE-family HTH domain